MCIDSENTRVEAFKSKMCVVKQETESERERKRERERERAMIG